jgi:hypothetical protein
MIHKDDESLREIEGLHSRMLEPNEGPDFVEEVLNGEERILFNITNTGTDDADFVASLGDGNRFYVPCNSSDFYEKNYSVLPVYRINSFDRSNDIVHVSLFVKSPQDPKAKPIHKLILEKMEYDLFQLEMDYADPEVPVDDYPLI